MKPILLVAFLASIIVVIAGCQGQAESSARAGNDYVVSKLFTHEGCTVYRFSDGGTRYYVNCSGGNSTVNWSESCGKNCTKTVTNTTGYTGETK